MARAVPRIRVTAAAVADPPFPGAPKRHVVYRPGIRFGRNSLVLSTL